jgi:acyl-coenzyme A thioesterase PaaI-like protein
LKSESDERQPGDRFTHWKASAMEPTTRAWAEKRRLATAMRRVIERLVSSDAPEQELALAADRLEQYAEHLKTHPRSKTYEGFAETSPSGNAAAFFDQSPLIGLSNPLAPPIRVEADVERRRVRATVTFGAAYEGPPGCVHGGFVAAAFDEVLGYANALSGSPGMTGTLTVRYREPTPLHTELHFHAELERVEGRKIFCTGRVYAGDRPTAEAEGIFISVDRQKFRGLLEARERRAREEREEGS